nr:hypothetical protein Iba_chr02bCG10900 [Ipomoea batatas]
MLKSLRKPLPLSFRFAQFQQRGTLTLAPQFSMFKAWVLKTSLRMPGSLSRGCRRLMVIIILKHSIRCLSSMLVKDSSCCGIL